jgi:aspartate carbamoyltransferase catalytic subunit
MHLLGLSDAKREELIELLDVADRFIDSDHQLKKTDQLSDALSGCTLGLLFFEPSTRTRTSFELAAQKLGAETILLDKQGTSVQKGESVVDTCRNLEAMGFDALVLRHGDRHLPFSVADRVDIPIINAGNGTGEHPTQALLDGLTLRQAFEKGEGAGLDGLNVTIIGDIVHSRVARSDVFMLNALGANVTLAGPSVFLPGSRDPDWNARTVQNRQEALQDADAVIMLRIQSERIAGNRVDIDRYIDQWGIDQTVVEEEMTSHCRIMHPGPVIRGVELTAAVADGPRSLILRQVTNGVAVRKAVLKKLLGEG